MEIMFVVIVVIGVTLFSRMKATAQAQAERQKRMEQQEKTRATTHYAPTTASPVQQVSGQIHMSSVLPDKMPPAVPVKREDPRMSFAPTEGIPFHPPGFHGDEKPRVSGSMEKKPLQKADLGAERAAQNAHTAQNLAWTAPKETTEQKQSKAAQRSPMFTPKQLRDAFIMQEILDEPVSRRKGIKRGYGS